MIALENLCNGVVLSLVKMLSECNISILRSRLILRKTGVTSTWRTKRLNLLGAVRFPSGLGKCGLNGNQQYLVCQFNSVSLLFS